MDDSDKIYQAAPTISQMGLSINDPNYFLDQVPEKNKDLNHLTWFIKSPKELNWLSQIYLE